MRKKSIFYAKGDGTASLRLCGVQRGCSDCSVVNPRKETEIQST